MRREKFALGLFAAAGAAMVVAFLAGCVYAGVVGTSQGEPFRLTADMLDFMLAIGGVAAMSAMPIAAIAALALGLPIFGFFTSRNYASPLVYVGGGVLISLAVGGTLAAAHYLFDFLDFDPDFRLAIFAAIAAGPVSSIAFWLAVRALPDPP
jgi:hypothetical protein